MPMAIKGHRTTLKGAGRDGRDGPPELGIPPTGSGRLGLWRSSGLVDRQHHQEEGPGKTVERGRVPQVPGADLE